MDYSAIGKAVFLNQMPHYVVIAMGVDAQIVGVLYAVTYYGRKHAVRSWQARHTMYHVIRHAVV